MLSRPPAWALTTWPACASRRTAVRQPFGSVVRPARGTSPRDLAAHHDHPLTRQHRHPVRGDLRPRPSGVSTSRSGRQTKRLTARGPPGERALSRGSRRSGRRTPWIRQRRQSMGVRVEPGGCAHHARHGDLRDSYQVKEFASPAHITVVRHGDTSPAISVRYRAGSPVAGWGDAPPAGATTRPSMGSCTSRLVRPGLRSPSRSVTTMRPRPASRSRSCSPTPQGKRGSAPPRLPNCRSGPATNAPTR